MKVLEAFELIEKRKIEELKTEARLYRHRKTGAEILSMVSDDENKVFGITFRTPPFDSTGVAHILEHSVLCGSKKYPVKEPFVELLKGSLQTFLNAFTYPDKTCYPVASQNLQDFYNLMEVYLDAVFYPRITPAIFQQEGWHFELEKKEAEMAFKGVVFNEMKGAYSSPDNVLSEYSLQSLFPDNAYGLDSGGDPKEIPNLTYEQFHAFHERYYHPSNARIFFYGDDDPEERLRRLEAVLEAFEPVSVDSHVQLQLPFDRPVKRVRPYMVGEEDGAARGMITVNWLLEETTRVDVNFSLRILEYILLGMPASPLRKALIDSGLGEDLTGGGLETELRQMCFSTGLKGIDTENAQKIEDLILDTLKSLSRSGIDPHTVSAALNTIEFRLRENNTGSFPRGLSLMLRSLTTWLYGGDPLALVAFEGPLERVKKEIAADPHYFEHLIDRAFLSNPHRSTLILAPDSDLRNREVDAEQRRLLNARAGMDDKALQAVQENTQTLKRLQEKPDSPEALSTIPMLKREDLVPKNKIIPRVETDEKGTPILLHDLFTNGIVYMDLGLDLQHLPAEYVPYIPLLGRAFVEMGTETEDFVSLTQRISRKTGGIHPAPFTSDVQEARGGTAWLFLRGKAMTHQADALIQIFEDVLLTVKLDNRKRFRQMVMEEKSRAEQKLIPAGHQMVNLRLRSHFSESHWASEQMGGISYLFFVRQLARDIENDWPKVLAVLKDIHRILVNRKTALANVTIDASGWNRFEPRLRRLLGALPDAPVSPSGILNVNWPGHSQPLFEGMTIPSQVNYVGKGADLTELGYEFHGSALAITRYVRNAWLWDRVRVQGGAYGAFCLLDRISGVLTFVSYRDPNLVQTLNIFDRAAQFLEEETLSKDELTKSIIGAIGDLDSHMLPDTRGFVSMIRSLTHDTENLRQQMREELLGTTTAHFKSMGKVLRAVSEEGVVKVLGSSTAMDAVEKERPGWLKRVKVL
ncbi:MAG: insulinase family protein [Deltaproteobacteria bacterium]|nr:insulinase family protein [Deltaproteobacteria bacterium]